MSLLSTIFKIPTKPQIGFLKLDASLSETHSRSADVTENEVEDGSVVSDHIRLKSKMLSITGQVSDAPVSILGLGVSTDDILGKANDFLDGKKASSEGEVSAPDRGPEAAWKYINELMENRTPFSIVTGLERYENMVISDLSVPRTSQDGKSLIFTGQLKQIVIIESSTVKIPAFKLDDKSANSASSKGKLGKQATKGATAKQTDNSSLLLKGFKKVGIF